MAIAIRPPRQIAYYVPDIREAATRHHAAFGSGPYFVAEHVPLAWSEHRGERVAHDHSSAYGQSGAVIIEFVQQHGTEPSAFADMFPHRSGRYGLHHTAHWVDDLDAAIADYESHGMPLAQLSETMTGIRYAFVDASATLGHMIEVYAASDQLTGFYAMVADAANGWNGSDPLRELG